MTTDAIDMTWSIACAFGIAPNKPTTPQVDGRTLPSCRSLGIQTVANDLNPFSPSAFTSFDVGKDVFTLGSMLKFNQALTYSIGKQLTYPNKSSVFREIMSTSKTLGEFADALPVAGLDVALIHGIYVELTAQCSYP